MYFHQSLGTRDKTEVARPTSIGKLFDYSNAGLSLHAVNGRMIAIIAALIRARRSFVAEGNHGIDAHGPPRGNVTSRERDDQKQKDDRDKRHRIVGLDLEEQIA